jgi:catechol 2,3-dioxygenase-like lactoylglutathione lyase family enzyme
VGEFRAAYFARDYEASVAFYRDGLELPVVESWDRGPDDRGTMFEAGGGRIEILALPADPDPESAWDHRPPQGVILVVERDEVDELFARVEARGVEIAEPLETQPWGHRSFVARDPEGMSVYLFTGAGKIS